MTIDENMKRMMIYRCSSSFYKKTGNKIKKPDFFNPVSIVILYLSKSAWERKWFSLSLSFTNLQKNTNPKTSLQLLSSFNNLFSYVECKWWLHAWLTIISCCLFTKKVSKPVIQSNKISEKRRTKLYRFTLQKRKPTPTNPQRRCFKMMLMRWWCDDENSYINFSTSFPLLFFIFIFIDRCFCFFC